jgi:hypothetical protein
MIRGIAIPGVQEPALPMRDHTTFLENVAASKRVRVLTFNHGNGLCKKFKVDHT